jgi:hypothetical protein
MFSVENFKPVKDLSTFESMYLKALDKIKKESEQKRQLFDSYKKIMKRLGFACTKKQKTNFS